MSAAGNPPALRARVLLALGEARIRRGEAAAGKALCREAAVLARALGDAELGARAALTYGQVFTFGVVDPVLVGMLEEALEALPPGDSALRARLLARLAGRAAAQPPRTAEPVALAREAIATARRLGDAAALLAALHAAIAALMDIVDRRERLALNLEVEQLALAAAIASACCARTPAWPSDHLGWASSTPPTRASTRFEALAARAARALVRLVGAAAPRGARHDARALRRGRALAAQAARAGPRGADPEATERSGPCTARGSCGPPSATTTCWPGTRRPAVRAAHPTAAAWQALGSALLHARLEDPAEARLHVDLLPEGFRAAGRQPVRDAVRRRGGRDGRPARAGRALYERLRPIRRRST